mgnify:CR=1 FL=1
MDPGRNPLIRLVRRVLPVTPRCTASASSSARTAGSGPRRCWWPLLCLEASDIVFAIDSVPAIFALTREPFIVFTSNVFAILGLRSMYFMLGGAVGGFTSCATAWRSCLVFVGLKMVWLDAWYGGKFPIGISLAIIGGVLGTSVGRLARLPAA